MGLHVLDWAGCALDALGILEVGVEPGGFTGVVFEPLGVVGGKADLRKEHVLQDLARNLTGIPVVRRSHHRALAKPGTIRDRGGNRVRTDDHAVSVGQRPLCRVVITDREGNSQPRRNRNRDQQKLPHTKQCITPGGLLSCHDLTAVLRCRLWHAKR